MLGNCIGWLIAKSLRADPGASDRGTVVAGDFSGVFHIDNFITYYYSYAGAITRLI